jgi:diguanylate cyclase (GGDEF)-like protein
LINAQEWRLATDMHRMTPELLQADQVIYTSDRTRVFRMALPGGAGNAICKQPRGADAAKRLRHEKAVLQRLSGVPGVPRLIGGPEEHPDALVLADGGGVPLSLAATGPWDIIDLVGLAAGFATVLAAVHERGVTHKDINPANILIAGSPDEPVLIDFDLATTHAEERPGFIHQSEITGTLAYLPPEQTGRTGRPVDQRADLYGLGATLYELATGAPPFGTGDPLRLIHDHLARVPVPPAEVNPAMPAALSDIILRLLEKEPDRRYQSAAGLAYDLRRLRDGGGAQFPLGEHDFPVRLAPPSRLVGRDAEVAALTAAFDSVVAGGCAGVVISGAPGVGKTRLVDELRPVITTVGGWFVGGKFDQHRQDEEADALRHALRQVGRLLLAEPESQLIALRQRLLDALGTDAGLVTAVLPEFQLLLGVPPQTPTGDPMLHQARLQQVGFELLRALADPARPLVLVVDDLQWAGPTPIGLLDRVLSDGGVPGLLLVCAYRESEVDEAHPLGAVLARWQRTGTGPTRLRLANLPRGDLGALLADMLRLAPEPAAALAEAVEPRTGGNPYDTVELVNALRREGGLVLGPGGWHWDPAALRGYVGRGDVVDLLQARISALPHDTAGLLEIMACLGGRADLDQLGAAAGTPHREQLEPRLAPALEEGLLVMDGADVVRFRHDRVQQAAFARLRGTALQYTQLAIARRLATEPALRPVAAAQYLAAVDALDDPAERHLAAELFREAAAHAKLLSNHAVVERLVAAAVDLTGGRPDVGLATEWHAALYSVGRLDEADALYGMIQRLAADPAERVEATCAQVSILTKRGRPADGLALGLRVLAELGFARPDDLGPAIEQGLNATYAWMASSEIDDDLRRLDLRDPRVLTAARLVNRMLPAAFFCDQPTMTWLALESRRFWAEYGPAASLVGPLSHLPFAITAITGDYRTGYRIAARVLAVSEARGYEPDTSQARFLYALGSSQWFEPLEVSFQHAHRAHEASLRGGDLENAGNTFYISVAAALDCAPTVDEFLAEVNAGLAYATRTGNAFLVDYLIVYRQLGLAMRGETTAPGRLDAPEPGGFTLAGHLTKFGPEQPAAANTHVAAALAALVFDLPAAIIVEHSASVMAFLGSVHGTYLTAVVRLIRALALARQATGSAEELDACRDWLDTRAADAPMNFRHLVRLIDAERAAGVGDLPAALAAFDEAFASAGDRPWHRAFIAERAARCHLASGLRQSGRLLLHEARRAYAAWGATGKVAQLDDELREPGRAAPVPDVADDRLGRSVSMSSDVIDLMAVLRASQALSSETQLDRLRARVTEVLSALTGATGVQVVLFDETWFVPGEVPIPLDEAGARGLLPLSAFRYAERSREPVVCDDATRDDRFARDPYFAGVERCSLLAVPILTRGALRAVLVLENRLSRAAFSAERLDGVMLITGQLAVSFDNALVYASLERKVAERTQELAVANARLEQLSVTDPLTGLANRRRLTDFLDAEWRRAVRPRASVGLAMIDIDYFKQYNDCYGHLAGDECLRKVAGTLRQHVRDTDLMARYGGEEFAAVLPGADLTATLIVAERIRIAIAALAEPHQRAPGGIVTVSIGVAAAIPPGRDAAPRLIEMADAMLYEAKRAGRNQVQG